MAWKCLNESVKPISGKVRAMTWVEAKVTILWENDCGETVYEEGMAATEAWEIVQKDSRAIYNHYLLPDGEIVDYMEFLVWYAGAFATV
jgi:hypothetical protein